VIEVLMRWRDRKIFEYEGRRTMTFAIVISLILHGSLALPVLLLRQRLPEINKNDKLLIELVGMVAERQAEASAATAAAVAQPTPPQKAIRSQDKKKVEQRKVAPTKTNTADSSVQVAQQEAQSSVPPLPPADNEKPSDQRKQQTLDVQDKNLDALKRYLGMLKRKIAMHLVYPEDAKKSGYEGMTVIKFRLAEDGSIQPGSLIVVRGSGQAALDANALKAARDSAPFERPARSMEVAVDVGFSLKNQ
jgi:TonB family protein